VDVLFPAIQVALAAGEFKDIARVACNLGKSRVILPNYRDSALYPSRRPRISMGWIGVSLIQGAGRHHSIAGKVDLETPRR
jgi:hypothetical protein